VPGALRSLALFVALVPVLVSLNAWPGMDTLLAHGAQATYTSAESAAAQFGHGEPAACHGGTACSGVPLPGATAFAMITAFGIVVAILFLRGATVVGAVSPRTRTLAPALLPPRALPST
jgi:hypothetical protein